MSAEELLERLNDLGGAVAAYLDVAPPDMLRHLTTIDALKAYLRKQQS